MMFTRINLDLAARALLALRAALVLRTAQTAPAIAELRAEMRTHFAKRLWVTPQQLDWQGRLSHWL
jgi:hypothetical protein